MPGTQPYDKPCRRGCGQTVTIGLTDEGNWMPFDDYDRGILHDCPNWKSQKKRMPASSQQEQSRPQVQVKQQQQSQPPAAATAEYGKILEEITDVKEQLTTLIWQVSGLRKKAGIDDNDDDNQEEAVPQRQ